MCFEQLALINEWYMCRNKVLHVTCLNKVLHVTCLSVFLFLD